MKVEVYRHLLDVNAGFDQAARSLSALRKHDAFQHRELDRFLALSKETRAAVSSYLVGVVEREETADAGRRFGERFERQQREERSSET
jgi:hypothetical protein